LMVTPIPPVQIFGAFVGSGILLAFLISVVLVPAYVVRMDPETLNRMQAKLHGDAQKGEHTRGLARTLPKVGRLTAKHAKGIISVAAIILAISALGITKIQINDNPVRWFKADHEIRVADRALNDHFAGTYDAWLVLSDATQTLSPAAMTELEALLNLALPDDATLKSCVAMANCSAPEVLTELITKLDDAAFNTSAPERLDTIDAAMIRLEGLSEASRRFLNPDVLAWIEALQRDLQASGFVGKSNALPDIVKTVNRELQSGNEADFKLPETAAGTAQTLLQYQSSHRPADLWHFVTQDYRQSLIWMQLTSGDNQHMNQLIDRVADYTLAHPLPAGLSANWAGKAYINVIWQDAMVTGMMESLTSSFLIVSLMMALLFRSVLFGLIAMLPLSLTITFIYGLVGWLGKDYDMPIAVLSALALGLSVDFAIHFLERTRVIYKATGNVQETLKQMFEEPARAITRNAVVIALGFTPLLLAPLVPYITVGVLMAAIMAISAAVTLLLLPSVLTVTARWAFPKQA
jgi:predicted RND superfamily exporter protein